jgi:ribonuclease R
MRRLSALASLCYACAMTSLPSKDQIRQWIAENPGLSSKRDLAKAFGLKGDLRAELKRLLREMEDEGTLEKKARRFRLRASCRLWPC